jgi:hypothetical protein
MDIHTHTHIYIYNIYNIYIYIYTYIYHTSRVIIAVCIYLCIYTHTAKKTLVYFFPRREKIQHRQVEKFV